MLTPSTLWSELSRISLPTLGTLTHDPHHLIHNFNLHVSLQIWLDVSLFPFFSFVDHQEIVAQLKRLSGKVEWISEKAEHAK